MKIQFIVVGWHYNQTEFYETLQELEKNNDSIDVFWSCHKEPNKFVKDNFKYKVFDNVGEEFIAYQQAIDYLELDDETICFFMHDDIIMKNWDFINECITRLNNGYKFIGNCLNYPLPEYNPYEVLPDGITEEFDNKMIRDYAKDSTKHLFDTTLSPVLVVRGSFMCTIYKYLKEVDGFEPRKEAWIGPKWNDEHQTYCYRNSKGLGKFGNLFLFMFSYKINRHFGRNSISYLSNRYLDSDYMYEMGRGEIDPNNPPR
tara:strand:- start:8572 stop:9345 length:774 start_codon:yes stop_codon:yes gene_type:complete